MQLHIGLLLLLLFPLSHGEGFEDVRCKESPVAGNTSKITAECWIQCEAELIPCQTTWDTLHLEIEAAERSTEGALSLLLFSQCANLRVLAIWKAGPLARLQREVFQPLPNLERLVIRSTRLHAVGQNLLLFLPNLQLLSITESRALRRLDKSALEPLPHRLTTLDLSNNHLGDILQPGLFEGHGLRNLYLQNNRISRLYSESLSGLSELRFLRLSGNQLSGSLESAVGISSPGAKSALLSTPKLEVLDLANNYLTEVVGCQWSGGCAKAAGLTRLRALNLAKNRLTWLDPAAFVGLPALTELRLEGNYDLFQAGSLPLVLFALTRSSHPALKHLVMPHESSRHGAIEMCWSGPPPTGSRILLRVLDHLKRHFCEASTPPSGELETTVSPKGDISLLAAETPVDEGPVFAFLRTTHRWVLTGIGIGLLLMGVLVSALIFVCLHFGLRGKAPDTKEAPKAVTRPTIVYTPSKFALSHVCPPGGWASAYLTPVRPVNGTPPTRNQQLARRRNVSNSVYSLLTAPPNPVPSAVASVNVIGVQAGPDPAGV